ncbi:PIN domain-like protein [Rhodofomes roseus]|uniref:PIN domain-like protein n=1 Tax=Rhodofomes roseus TaxID=34475 RepID=A0ABQ8KVG0_9APHY|nr:PIN domain-like protein [Rhodofomes roseus]XP_047783365.1 PIN domain-like protein [Rhodofomes roseus]XP_047783370.1 PIN domain-like protein [Rhodofomes roseus]KAH9842311.1 PIN domain-like protein [Rhodofomes roseus]KAH9842318.1 PIN domain-like protein [Rhodofomes roseus]KAH9842323.1 PIN domain-like protein [Rhodofomes roseus]
MGVHGLWEAVKPAATGQSIEDFFVREGFEQRKGERVYRLGIDASIWLYQVQNTFAVGHAQSGENPELRTLFFRLARLLRLLVHATFVFDGQDRPPKKRGKKVIKTSHWMVAAMKQFIDAFGYDWWMAPGEAEAELALMNSFGIFDGVLTDDSDTLLFGAQVVIRNYSAKDQMLTVVSADSIFKHQALRLTRPGMILFALLTGGDYETGLQGFGPRVACGLARYGFGERLCEAVRKLHGDALSQFLSSWRDDLRVTLRTDNLKLLGRRYQSLSDRIPDTFPNLAVVDLYRNPVTSPLEDFEKTPAQPPDVASLGVLCERYFSWGTPSGIIERFGNCLLPGVVLRSLIKCAINRDMAEAAKEPLVNQLEGLVHVNPDKSPRRSNNARFVTAIDTGFAALAVSGLVGLRPDDGTVVVHAGALSRRFSMHETLVQHLNEESY